ncbi:hypothetical protein EV586_105288 [Tumebacillus sp. BK434]|uniref:hypothetical protein n=1 Tax=Tumebacillus sp. BK434 TaxID=2512169 RepID=UPI001051D5A7|nr:hypothetical protein [Tumebacillus sp. BK434]TCP53942.1 hypothetical protein EV586_105288 [Tumebacillus sp. BK434]
METKGIQRDKQYTLFELADRAGITVADVQELVHRGKLDSHYTDDTEMVNGKDFLNWAERVEQADEGHRHYQ